MLISILIVLAIISLPLIIMLVIKYRPRKDSLVKQCEIIIKESAHKIIAKTGKVEIVYTYLKEASYGSELTKERRFYEKMYEDTVSVRGNVETAMEDRVRKLSEEYPDAIVEVIVPV